MLSEGNPHIIHNERIGAVAAHAAECPPAPHIYDIDGRPHESTATVRMTRAEMPQCWRVYNDDIDFDLANDTHCIRNLYNI
jgi:hypothetical protein